MSAEPLQPHQQRVIDERTELDERIAKLGAFINSPIFASLPEDERERLVEQRGHMHAYSDVLRRRIEAFAGQGSLL